MRRVHVALCRLDKTSIFVDGAAHALRHIKQNGRAPNRMRARLIGVMEGLKARPGSALYTAIDLVVAIVLYALIVKLWRIYRENSAS